MYAPAPMRTLMSNARPLPSTSSPSQPNSRAIVDRFAQDVAGVRVLRAQVDVALRGADRERRDRHALEQRERVALDEHAVGEGAAVALVGVAADVLAVSPGASSTVCHLRPAGKPAPPRPRRPDAATVVDDVLRCQARSRCAIRPARRGPRSSTRSSGSITPMRAYVRRSCRVSQRKLVDRHRARVSGQRQEQAGVEQVGDVVRLHRAVADASAVDVDLDERFEPEHAARPVTNDARCRRRGGQPRR